MIDVTGFNHQVYCSFLYCLEIFYRHFPFKNSTHVEYSLFNFICPTKCIVNRFVSKMVQFINVAKVFTIMTVS